MKDPMNDDLVPAHEHWANTLRGHRFRLCHDLTFVRHMHVSPDSWHRLVLLHRRILRVKLLTRLSMCILFNSRDEALKRLGSGHSFLGRINGRFDSVWPAKPDVHPLTPRSASRSADRAFPHGTNSWRD